MAVPVTRRYRSQGVSKAELQQLVAPSAFVVARYADALDVQVDPGVPGTTDTLDEFMLGAGYVFDSTATATPVGGNYIQSSFAELLGDVAAPGAFADLLTVAIATAAAASRLKIVFSASIGLSLSLGGVLSTASFRVLLDGVALRGSAASASLTGSTASATLTLQVPVTAGPHVVTLQWQVIGVLAAAAIRPVTRPDLEHASLLVEEVFT